MSDKEKRTIGQIAWQTKLLVETFLNRPVDKLLTYGELRKLFGGIDPQREGRGYVTSARRILLHQHDTVIACEPNIGYKKVEGVDAMGEAVSEHRKVRHVARKAGRILCATEYEKLSDADKLRWNGEMVQNALIQKVSDGKASRQLAARFSDRSKFEIDQKKLQAAFDAVKDTLATGIAPTFGTRLAVSVRPLTKE